MEIKALGDTSNPYQLLPTTVRLSAELSVALVTKTDKKPSDAVLSTKVLFSSLKSFAAPSVKAAATSRKLPIK